MKKEERDGKKVDGLHVYFSERESKTNTIGGSVFDKFSNNSNLYSKKNAPNKAAYIIIEFVLISFQIHSIKNFCKKFKMEMILYKGLCDYSHYIKTNWR